MKPKSIIYLFILFNLSLKSAVVIPEFEIEANTEQLFLNLEGVCKPFEGPQKGDLNAIKKMLFDGANPNKAMREYGERYTYPFLNRAIETKKLEIVDAIVNAKSQSINKILLIFNEVYPQIPKVLVELIGDSLWHDVNLNIKVPEVEYPLGVAVGLGVKDIVKLLVEKKANVNVKNKFDTTPLLLAAKNQFTDIACLLIENGADYNASIGDDCNIFTIPCKQSNFPFDEIRRNPEFDRQVKVTIEKVKLEKKENK